jgi:hypothetical protein
VVSFPAFVLGRARIAFTRQRADGRSTVTKPEWMLWAACLAADRPLLEDWSERIVRYANETPSRVPFSDLYFVESGRKMGFQARSVVGGVWVAILAERWKA